jgi:hypothetical protein
MTNLIKNKIDKIFSEELNNNRKLILKEGIASNKFVRKSLMNNMDDNFKVIKKYQKRKSQEEIFSKHMKFMNDNDDNDITIKNKTKKLNDNINNINPNFGKITKVQTQGDIKNYFGDVNILIDEKEIHNTKIKSCINKKFNESESGFKGTPSNSKRTNRNAIILVEEKPIEEHKKSDNKLKRKKTTTKKSIKNIVMIEKQKYPKKETIFDRIKGSIKRPNKELSSEENISVKKSVIRRNSGMSPKKCYKSIKAVNSKFKIYSPKKENNRFSNDKKYSTKIINGDNDSSNFIKSNPDLDDNDSINSNIKSKKFIKADENKNKYLNLKIDKNNNISENEGFQSSRFSNSSCIHSEDNEKNKNNISPNKESVKDSNKIKSGKILYLHPKKLSKDSSPKIKQIQRKKLNDEKNNKQIQKSKKNSKDSSFVDSSDNDKNKKESEKYNSENNNESNNEEPINKKIHYKYNQREGGVLSIIPEQDNKNMFYEDINQNIEVIKPENVISLEKNTNKGKKNSRNVEINKNNIIINNNVSNNITVHNKKESDTKKEENKREEENKSSEKNKRGKSYKVKARKKFPFCCL